MVFNLGITLNGVYFQYKKDDYEIMLWKGEFNSEQDTLLLEGVKGTNTNRFFSVQCIYRRDDWSNPLLRKRFFVRVQKPFKKHQAFSI